MHSDNPQTRIKPETIIELVSRRAQNIYENHKLCCSESLLLVFNHGFNGGLTTRQAKQLGAGFCGGIGEAGCTCGALSGAVMGLGLIAGPHSKDGLSKKKFRILCKKMHDRFHDRFSSTCCRVLIEPFAEDKKGRSNFCSGLTAATSAICAEVLLEFAPGLANQARLDFLTSRESKLSGLLKKLPE